MTRLNTVAGHAVEQHNSPNRGGAMSDHRGVVLHIAEGTYRGTIAWQMNPDQRYASGGTVTTSSTFVLGREPGEVAQMVDTDTIAWCQRDGSRTWLSIELAGFAPNPPTAWQIQAAADILAWSHRRYGHALAIADNESERGLGHHSMDRESWGVEWGHDSCPGSGVVSAKPAILRRAQDIMNGEDDMANVTDAQLGRLLKAADAVLGAKTFSDKSTRDMATSAAEGASGVMHGKTIGGGSIYLSQQFDKVNAGITALIKGVVDDADKAEILAAVAAVGQAVDQVDDNVLAQLGAGDLTAQEKADLLRAVLGDDAAAVGVLLQV